MDTAHSFLPLLIVLLIAVFVPILLSRLGRISIPIVVGEILAGMVVGRSGIAVVPPDDPLLIMLANFGIVFLMFLSGMEIDFQSLRFYAPAGVERLRTRIGVFPLACLHFALTLSLASCTAYILVHFELATNVWIMALILSTTSLGVVLPVLKETDFVTRPLGQYILVTAVIADFATMFLITVAVAIVSQGLTAKILLIALLFVAFFFAYRFGTIFNKVPALRRTIEELSHATAQIKVRAAFAVMLAFVALSQTLGSEIILGAFLAGAIVGLLRTADDADLSRQLEAIGFGFFIPIFFIKAGVEFNLPVLLASRGALLLVPFLVIGAILVKVVPAFTSMVNFSLREALAAGTLLSARLSLIIAAAAIGRRLGVIGESVHAAIILVAVVTVTAAPLIFVRLVPVKRRSRLRRIVVVGAEELGLHVAKRLKAHLEALCIIDPDAERIARATRNGFDALCCPVEHEDSRMKSACATARALVCTYDDPDLAYRVCELARNVYEVPHVVAQLTDPSRCARFDALGVTTMNAALDRPSLLALLARTPAVYSLFSRTDDNKEVCEVVVTDGRDVDKPLRELSLPGGLLALAIRRDGELLVPHGNTRLCRNDRLTLVGSVEDIEQAKQRFSENGPLPVRTKVESEDPG
ncbi:MAG TPA: cation:proton antiporter [Candidatus Acidoferrales bacterium]|nr:cation:proton antiporter [Candidatus Acidoferrales bacterium]